MRGAKKVMVEVPRPVPITDFGKDHWSALMYVEGRCVDHKGKLDMRHLRIDRNRHPHLAHMRMQETPGTYLNGGRVLADHDDWDCINDLLYAELLTYEISIPTDPILRLLDAGWSIAGKLRRYRAEGGQLWACRCFPLLGPERAYSLVEVRAL